MSAFAPNTAPKNSFALRAAQVDSYGNNIAVKNLLTQVESSGLLTKVASSGLLSKAQDAGITLTKLEPLLALSKDYPEVLVLAEAAGPDLLPLLPKIVDLAPGVLPLLASGLKLANPNTLSAASIAALGAAGALVVLVPDDSILEVAAQTAGAGALVGIAAASSIGAGILKKVL